MARGGELVLGSRFGDLDSLANYDWTGRRAVIKVTDSDYASAVTRFDGEMGGVEVGLDEAVVRLADKDGRFDSNLQQRLYRGSSACLWYTSGSYLSTTLTRRARYHR